MESLINTIENTCSKIFQNQEIIANNIANASTTGFKSELESKIILSHNNKNNLIETKNIYKHYKNNTQGMFKKTNQPLDFAIKNKNSWFVIKLNPKTIAYTKNGHFKINSNRKLMIQNHAVLGTNGDIVIPNNTEIIISSNGVVSIKKDNETNYPIAKLRFKTFNINNLIHDKNGFYLLNKNSKIEKNKENNANVQLIPGTLEDSNVNLEENLINMIENSRKFDTQMKILSMYNENTQLYNKFLNLN
ncbi:MAG: flagellar basal-body rod protein FlgF [Buchnera aphidicola (Chaetogeoica yunlongensis)]